MMHTVEEAAEKIAVPEDVYQALAQAANTFQLYGRLFLNEGTDRWRKRVDAANENAADCLRVLDTLRIA